jgi:glycosyltransferase involved in cell wall biosynthesis
VQRRLERLGLAEGVTRLDYVPEEGLWALMAACDALVNLRYPTMGETSGSVIRALSLGKPLIVSDVGWFSELPDGVVLKVPVDEYEVATLKAALGVAVDHGTQLAAAAREYVARAHDVERAADAYVEALEVSAGGDAVADAVLWRIAEAAAEVGIDDPAALARAAREAGIVA